MTTTTTTARKTEHSLSTNFHSLNFDCLRFPRFLCFFCFFLLPQSLSPRIARPQSHICRPPEGISRSATEEKRPLFQRTTKETSVSFFCGLFRLFFFFSTSTTSFFRSFVRSLAFSPSLLYLWMPHWSVVPLAIVGTVAFSIWFATCCFGEERLRSLLGRRAADAAAADVEALPGRGADRPTADLLNDLERS